MAMLKYVVKRFVVMMITLYLIATATFFMLAAVPGDALTDRVSRLPDNVAQRVYERYGLDKPVIERYWMTMGSMIRGDFGESIVYANQTIPDVIAEKGPVSARLGIQQVVVGVAIGLILGLIATLRKNTWVDYLIITVSILLVSVPTLVFALLLQQTFAGQLGWFPVIGWPRGADALFGGWKYTILPTLAGCFGYIATYSRLLKASMTDVLGQDYLLAAEARGLSRRQVVMRHMLRNSFIPIITSLPMSLTMALTGSFFIETIFAIPGLGMYYIQAVGSRDVTMVMGFTVLVAAIYIVTIFITDILYHVVDPRIRLATDARR